MIPENPDKKVKSTDEVESDLFNACKDGRTEVLEDAIKNNLNLDIYNLEGLSLLHEAAAYGRVDMCKNLIAHGIDVDVRAIHGVTPLMVAVHQGKVEVVKLLLQCGADIDITDDDGALASRYAEHARQIDCLRLLTVKRKEKYSDKASDNAAWISISLFLFVAIVWALIAWNL